MTKLRRRTHCRGMGTHGNAICDEHGKICNLSYTREIKKNENKIVHNQNDRVKSPATDCTLR